MTWTAVCDFSFEKYDKDLVLDSTDFHNNGKIMGNITPAFGYTEFKHPEDQIVIPVNDSLSRFIALKIEATIRPEESGRRLNIVEGWMSFAFFIESNGELMATIYDGKNWVAVSSGPLNLDKNKYSTVAFEYDGVCIGKLFVNGQMVSLNINMPLWIHQPQQNITIGHWPSGDGRYTFNGTINLVKIYRRDYDNFVHDSMANLFCKKKLTYEQLSALNEITILLRSLDPKKRQKVVECSINKANKIIELFHAIRAGNINQIRAQTELGIGLRDAWCCNPDTIQMKSLLLNYLEKSAGPPNSEQRKQFNKWILEFKKIMHLCEGKKSPFKEMNHLLLKVFPEMAEFERQFDEIANTL